MRTGSLVLLLVGLAGGSAWGQPARDSARTLDFVALRLVRDIGRGRGGGRSTIESAARAWREAATIYDRLGDSVSAVDRRVRSLTMMSLSGWRDSVLQLAPEVIRQARAIGDPVLESSALFAMAEWMHGPSAGTDDALLDSALTIYRRLADMHARSGDRWNELRALYQIGLVHVAGERQDSVRHYDDVLKSRLPDIAAVRRQIALAAVSQVSITGARAALDSALRTAQRIGDRWAESHALALLGSIDVWLGRTDSAAASYDRALALAREIRDRGGQRFMSGAMLGRLGADFDVDAERHPWDATGEAGLLVGLAAVHRARGEKRASSDALQRALQMAGQTLDPQLELMIRRELAQLYDDTGAPDSALAQLGGTLWLADQIQNKDGRDWEGYRALASSHAALLQLRMGQRDSAEAAITRAKSEVGGVGLSLRAPIYRNIAAYHRALDGDAGVATAIAYYDSAATRLAQELFNSSNRDVDRISLAEQSARVHQERVLTWLAGHADGAAMARGKGALAIHEDGLAAGLRNLAMAAGQGSVVGVLGVYASEAEKTADLLVNPLTFAKSAALEFALTPDTLIVWLITAKGEMFVSRRAVNRDSLGLAVAAFRSVLGVDDASASGSRAPPPLEPNDAVRGVGIATKPGDGWQAAAGTLGRLLLPADLVTRIPAGSEIVIVPQGILGLVPFAALRLEDGALMGARYALRYSPSLAMLATAEEISGDRWAVPQDRWGLSREENDAWLARRERQRVLRAPIVLANPIMPAVRGTNGQRIGLSPLPGSEAEGERVAAVLRAKPLKGDSATEALFKRRAGTASLLHLATHGFAYSDEARSRESFVALAPGNGQDGVLTVGEILDQLPALRAELVVLSACQTGLGNLKQAEGTVGIQRAFLARGARSVVVTLWSVSDEATSRLMTAFYRHWLDDTDHPSKAVALFRAQQSVRDSAAFSHPRYWAAFQVVGAR